MTTKIQIITLFLLIPTFVISQLVGVKVTYGVTFENLNADTAKEYSEIYKQAKDGEDFVTFSLEIYKNESLFYLNPVIQSKATQTRLTEAFTLGSSKIYMNISTSEKITVPENRTIKKNEFLISENISDDWKLTEEKKTIDGFLCYKAISILNVSNSKGDFKHDIIAWYCPEISFSFGPKGYGKLPGLILELQLGTITYGVRKINLDQKIDLEKIKKPTKGKTVSYSEYEKIRRQRFNDFFKSEKN